MKKELFKKSNLGTGLVASVQPYKYTGKELDRETGLDWYDSQARMLDPTTGRTTTMDPMAEKYTPMSPYLWCGGNPVNSIDIDGKELRIGGVMSEDAFNQLHTKVSDKNFILEMGKDGLVVYSRANTKLSKNQMRIKEIIEDSAISVNIDATNTYETAEGDYFVAGAFGGNQVDNNDFGKVVKVTAKQTVNPCVLEKAETYTGIGTSLMHEITEAYEGAKISESTKISSPSSNRPNSVYDKAHKKATVQPTIYYRMYDKNGNETKFKDNAKKLEWFVTPYYDSKYETVIQTMP